MTNSFTPGPWTVECDAVAMANQIVILSPAPDGASRDEIKANARLIAAAPDLLAALKLLHERLTECSQIPATVSDAYDSFYQDLVRAAIAKATAS